MNKTVRAVLVLALLAGAASGETFSWKHIANYSKETPPASPVWQSFADAGNWQLGDISGVSENTTGRYPGAEDIFYFGRYNDYAGKLYCMDLGGEDHVLKGIKGGNSQWLPYFLLLKNGSLSFTESFTNNYSFVYIYDNCTFTLGETSSSKLGAGDTYNRFHAFSGGTVNLFGDIVFQGLQLTVEDGAEATIKPTRFAFDKNSKSGNPFLIRNSGTMNLPQGLIFAGGWTQSGPCILTFEQMGGVLTLGGNFGKISYSDTEDWNNNQICFVLGGGTVNAEANVGFSSFSSAIMTNDAVATVNVAEGKTLNLSKMVFNAGTKLVKRGPGSVRFDASLPESLSVEEGSFALGANKRFRDLAVSVDAGQTLDLTEVSFEPDSVFAKRGEGTVVFGASAPAVLDIEGGKVDVTKAASFASVSFAPGAAMHIGNLQVSAKTVIGAENAVITVSEGVLSAGLPFFTVDDEDSAKVLARKIVVAQGFAGVGNAGKLTVEKSHDPALFYWKYENNSYYWNFYDPTVWGAGDCAAAANDEGLIPGEDDEISYCTRTDIWAFYLRINMQGGARWVKSFKPADKNIWSKRILGIKNGFLGFNTLFETVKVPVTVSEGGRFALGESCSSRFGYQGNDVSFDVKDTGSVDIKGDIVLQYMNVDVKEGGSFSFAPASFAYDPSASQGYKSSITNNGNCAFSKGFRLDGRSKGNCVFSIVQSSGEMVLGGDVKMESAVDFLDFSLTGGVVRVTGDAAFVGCRNVEMANDAAAEVSVAAEKTADFSAMEFGAGTELTKTGTGALKLGLSLPGALAVTEGSLVLSGGSALGSRLSLGGSAKIVLAGNGISFDSIDGLENAVFSVEPQALANGAALVRSSDRAALEIILEKIAAQVGQVSSSRRGVVIAESAAGNGVYELKVFSTRGLKVIVK